MSPFKKMEWVNMNFVGTDPKKLVLIMGSLIISNVYVEFNYQTRHGVNLFSYWKSDCKTLKSLVCKLFLSFFVKLRDSSISLHAADPLRIQHSACF